MTQSQVPSPAFVDGHCHLANLGLLMPLEPILADATACGITGWLSSALTQTEVQYHLNHPDPRIIFSAGIHPNYEDCDLTLDVIASLCATRKIWAVGEIGLDRQGPPLQQQEEILIPQLEIASEHYLPVVLHIVGHQQRAYEILKAWPLRYLVHGYAGSVEGFRLLARLDSHFTLSERILRPDKHALLCEMLSTRRFLAETDITRHYVRDNEPNPLFRLLDVISGACERGGVTRADFERTQNDCLAALMEHSYG